MLDQIEATIKNLPSISFEEYYTDFVDRTQDRLISSEISRISSFIYGAKSIMTLEKSVEKLVEGMTKSNDIFN